MAFRDCGRDVILSTEIGFARATEVARDTAAAGAGGEEPELPGLRGVASTPEPSSRGWEGSWQTGDGGSARASAARVPGVPCRALGAESGRRQEGLGGLGPAAPSLWLAASSLCQSG